MDIPLEKIRYYLQHDDENVLCGMYQKNCGNSRRGLRY